MSGYKRKQVVRGAAFTLLEVMVALGIFFMCLFAVLELVSGTLRNARALQRNEPEPAMVAAELSLTNAMVEGSESGDFGSMYPGWTWTKDKYPVSSNGLLYQIDITVSKQGSKAGVEERLSVLRFMPNSAAQVGPPKGQLQ
jgi:type II secretion system protein I